MYDAWYIVELQEIILSYCTSGTLFALARTSRFLKDPALNLLWSHGDIEFQWLLNLLPAETWKKLVPADVATFSNYAKRVIHLKLSGFISPDLMRQLPNPICPNLRSLTSRFDAGDAECNSIIRLLGPNVDSISLDNCSRMKPYSAASLFSYIVRYYPSIKVFKATLGRLGPSSYAVNEKIGTTIVRLIAPSYIAVTGPNPAIMAQIASRKTIEGLMIQNPTEQAIQSLVVDGRRRTQFTNLSRLSLDTSHCGGSSICHLISAIPPERLQTFTLNVYKSQIPLGEWRMLHQKLGQRHSSTMQILSIVDHGLMPSCPLHSVLEFLLNMRNLTDIVWINKMDGLSDDEVEEMTLAWPNLRRLVLTAQATLAGYSIMENHFPELQELRISLDRKVTTAEWSDYQLRAMPLAWPHLRKLDIMPGEVTLAGFACLVKRYPRLQELKINLLLEVPSREWVDDFMGGGACNPHLTYLFVGDSSLQDGGLFVQDCAGVAQDRTGA